MTKENENKGSTPDGDKVFVRFEQILAVILLFVLSPILWTMFVLVRSTSRGPVFYKKQQIGLRGKTFLALKIRTVHVPDRNREDDATKPRVTMVGRSLRQLGLDKLPQLYNVVRGDIRLGAVLPPRPAVNEFAERKLPLHDSNDSICIQGVILLDRFQQGFRYLLPRKTREQVFDPVIDDERIDFLEDIARRPDRWHGYMSLARLAIRLMIHFANVLLGAIFSRAWITVSGWVASLF